MPQFHGCQQKAKNQSWILDQRQRTSIISTKAAEARVSTIILAPVPQSPSFYTPKGKNLGLFYRRESLSVENPNIFIPQKNTISLPTWKHTCFFSLSRDSIPPQKPVDYTNILEKPSRTKSVPVLTRCRKIQERPITGSLSVKTQHPAMSKITAFFSICVCT